MDEVGVEFRDEVGIEGIVGDIGPKKDYDVEKFRKDDKSASEMTMGYREDPASLRKSMSEADDKVRKKHASKQSKIPIVQKFHYVKNTILGKSGVQLNNEAQEKVDGVHKKSEGLQKGFARKISKRSTYKGRLLDKLARIEEEYNTLENAKIGYTMQMDEIDNLMEANRNGTSIDDVVLKVCPQEYKTTSLRSLQNYRGKIETKKLNSEIVMQTKYLDAKKLGGEIARTKAGVEYTKSQLTKAQKTREKLIDVVMDNSAPEYTEAFEDQIEMAELGEEMEEVCRDKNEIAAELFDALEEQVDYLMADSEPDFGDSSHIMSSKKTLDDAMDVQIKKGNEDREIQRTGAKAVFEKYLG